MSTDLHTLSGAYAIDALSAEEAAQFEQHLEQCQACRDEVRELQAAAATMGASEAVAPPSALRARVLAAADRQPQLPPQVTPIERVRSRGWLPRVASLAAAVVLVVGVVLVVKNMQDSPAPPAAAPSVSQVFDAPDARTRNEVTSNGGRLKVATSAEFGQMAVSTRGLPKLEHRTYQMWALRNGHATSVGLLDDPEVGKVMPLPAAGTEVAITIEPTGGSKTPSLPPIITVDPQDL